MTVDPRHLQIGMEVVGSDGEFAGTVKEVRETAFHLDRPMARDVMVPLDAVQAIVDATASDSINPRVILTLRANSIGDSGWPHPS